MSDPGLNYRVTVTGASQGAAEIDRLATAAGRTGDSTKKASEGTKTFAEALESLGGRNNAAKDALEGISTAARGGEGAMFGFYKAFKAFKELASGGLAALGPGGAMAAGIGILIGLLPKLIELFKGATESAEQLALRTEQAKAAATALGQARMDNLKEALDAISKSSGDASEKLKILQAAAERIDNAKKAAALAKIDASDMTDAEKTAARARLEKADREERDQRKLQGLAGEVGINEENVAKLNAAAEKRKEAMDEAQKEVAKQANVQNSLEEFKTYREKHQNALGGFDTKAEADRYEALKRISETQKFDPASFEQERKNFEGARAAYVAADDARKEGQRKLDSSKFAYNVEKDTQAQERPYLNQVDVAKLLPTQRQAKDAAAQAGKKAEQAAASGDWTAQGDAVSDRRSAIRDTQTIAAAAKKIGDTKPISGEDMSKAVDKLSQNISTNTKQSQEAITKTAGAIQKQAESVPPPPDFTPLATAITALDFGYKSMNSATNRRIDDLSRQIETLARQAANSR